VAGFSKLIPDDAFSNSLFSWTQPHKACASVRGYQLRLYKALFLYLEPYLINIRKHDSVEMKTPAWCGGRPGEERIKGDMDWN